MLAPAGNIAIFGPKPEPARKRPSNAAASGVELSCFDNDTANEIDSAVHRMIRRTSLTESDRPEVTNEMAKMVFSGLKKYDPTKGARPTFVRALCRNSGNSILRSRFGKKNSILNGAQSLNESRKQEDRSQDTRAECGGITHDKEVDMRHDVDRLLSHLTDEQRALCIRLKTEDLAQVETDPRCRQSPLETQLAAIRKLFEQNYMHEYLC